MPHLDNFFGLDNILVVEKRDLAEKPKLELKNIDTYPEKFESFYNDNFGFRQKLISLNSILKVKLFHTSPKSDRAIVGKDNWLFYWKNGIRNSYLNKNPFDGEDLGKLGAKLKSVNEWATLENRIFLVTIFPNKHSIYEEMIPKRLRKLKKPGMKRLYYTYKFLNKENINNVEQEEFILGNKGTRPLYLKNDSHWNSLGAFYAYQNIIEKISSLDGEIQKPLKIEDFEIETDDAYRKGDLLNLMGIDNQKGFFEDTYFKFKPYKLNNFKYSNNSYGIRSVIIDNPEANNDKTALFFGDSYSTELQQFLPIHFNKTIFVRNVQLYHHLINKIDPDIVVYGIVERNLEIF